MIDFDDILKNGITIHSSGSSGPSKPFYQSPKKILAAAAVASRVQNLTPQSKIYTCCKPKHAGGLFTQTIPGHLVGASITIEEFSAYQFVREISKYTHTHITPLHAKAIMKTKGFKNLNLEGIVVMCGAEPVTWDIIEAFVQKGCTFISNWGMSEIGPVAINYTFTNMEQVEYVKSICPEGSTVLGKNSDCLYYINSNAELVVKGDICIYEVWYNTKDLVEVRDGILFYKGRSNAEVDFDNPKKG
jgi:acyl-coenzyme A synthetase/AMP-(fatty) acid ligase